MAWLRALVLFPTMAWGLWSQPAFYLRNGDRVVFYGDSITDQRLYTTFAETYAVTRFPKDNFIFIHSGWGGDRVSGGGGGPIDLRLERDVLAYKPTVMTIMLGMNDAGYKPLDQNLLNTYEQGYEHILKAVQTALPGIRITAIQPSPYDDVTQPPSFEGGYNAVLIEYSKFVKKIAANHHIDTADLNTPVVNDLKRASEIDPPGAKKLIADRVHPGPAGHLLMAEALLKAWNAPSVVSEVTLNIQGPHIDKTTNATVSDWNGASWTETERALPMPIDWKDPSTVLAIKASDFLDALDREILRITGLHAGRWQLKIDGNPVGSFTSDELDSGINLARLDTPMMQQAAAVHNYTKRHATLHNVRWREVQVPLAEETIADKDAAMKSLDRLEAEVVAKQHRTAQPKPHKFEIVAQP